MLDAYVCCVWSFVYYHFVVDMNSGAVNNIIISSFVSFFFILKVIVLYHISYRLKFE